MLYICHWRIGGRGETHAGGRQKHHVTECSDRCWGRGESQEDQRKNGGIPLGAMEIVMAGDRKKI